MAKRDIPQISFSAGVVSPNIYSRVDLNKFGSAIAVGSNFYGKIEGGQKKRSGLEFVAKITETSSDFRIRPFKFNEEQTYALEFGNQYIKVYANGALLLESNKNIGSVSVTTSVTLTVTNHGYSNGDHVFVSGLNWPKASSNYFYTIQNVTTNTFELVVNDVTRYASPAGTGTVARVLKIATPYLASELADIDYRQSNDVLYLAHPNHKPRTLKRLGASNWALTEITFAPKHIFPEGLSCSPVSTGSTTYAYKVTAVATETFEESLTAITSSKTITAITQANPALVTIAAHGYSNDDEVYIKDIVGMTELNNRRFIVKNVTTNTFELSNEDSTSYTAYSSGGNAYNTVTRITNGNATANNTIAWNAVVGTEKYNIYKNDNGTYGFIGSTESLSFTDANVKPDATDTAPKLRQPFSKVGDYPSCVGLHEQRSAWGASTNNPLFVWMSQTGQFENMNISSPTKSTDAVTVRLVTGEGNEIRHFRSFADRLMIFTSGAIWSMRPGGDVDAITPASKKLSIEEYLPTTNTTPIVIGNNILLVAGTSKKGFEVHQLGYQPNNKVYGSEDLTVLSRHLFESFTIEDWAYGQRPNRLLLAIRNDGKLIAMNYYPQQDVRGCTLWETNGKFKSVTSIEEDGLDVFYFVIERTINGSTHYYVERLASTLFTTIEKSFYVDSGLKLDITSSKTITAITQANPPVITSANHGYANGDYVYITNIVGMTELNNRQFTIQNVTTNTFELVGEDSTNHTAYTSGGTSQKKVKTIYGLDHLIGEKIVVLVDGAREFQTVDNNGSITASVAGSIFSIGLGYDAHIQSLPVNQSFYTLSKQKIPKNVTLRFHETRGILVGTDINDLEEYTSRPDGNWSRIPPLAQNIIKIPIPSNWSRDSSIIVKSQQGLPMTLLSWVVGMDIS